MMKKIILGINDSLINVEKPFIESLTNLRLYTHKACKDYKLWVLFVVSIYVAFACSFPSLQFECDLAEPTCTKLNGIFQSFSLSYVAGFVFYLLSDFIPSSRRQRHNLSVIGSLLIFYEQHLHMYVHEMGKPKEIDNGYDIADWYKKTTGVEYKRDKLLNKVTIQPHFVYMFNEIAKHINTQTRELASLVDNLDEEDSEKILRILYDNEISFALFMFNEPKSITIQGIVVEGYMNKVIEIKRYIHDLYERTSCYIRWRYDVSKTLSFLRLSNLVCKYKYDEL